MYHIYLRMTVYVVTILVHVVNITYLTSCYQGEVMKNHFVKHFHEMSCYFFTCWNVMFQTTYAALSLYCDITILKNSKRPGFNLAKILTDCQDALYCILVWPATMLVAIVFWTIYFYDRSIIYPIDIDMVIPSISNYIVHIFIVPIAVLETIFRPRTPPEDHKRYLLSVISVEVIYFSTVLGVYKFKGVWVYPFFGLFGSATNFFAFFAAVAALLVLCYYGLWMFNDFMWGPDRRSTEKNLNSAESRCESRVKKIT